MPDYLAIKRFFEDALARYEAETYARLAKVLVVEEAAGDGGEEHRLRFALDALADPDVVEAIAEAEATRVEREVEAAMRDGRGAPHTWRVYAPTRMRYGTMVNGTRNVVVAGRHGLSSARRAAPLAPDPDLDDARLVALAAAARDAANAGRRAFVHDGLEVTVERDEAVPPGELFLFKTPTGYAARHHFV